MMSGDDVDGASKTNTLHLHIGLQDAEKIASDDVRFDIVLLRLRHSAQRLLAPCDAWCRRSPTMTTKRTTLSLLSMFSGKFREVPPDFR